MWANDGAGPQVPDFIRKMYASSIFRQTGPVRAARACRAWQIGYRRQLAGIVPPAAAADLCSRRSTQILWKRLWARTLINIKVFEFKQKLLSAPFLSMPCQAWICVAGHRTMRRQGQGVHTNCGKQCEQGCGVAPKSLIAWENFYPPNF